MIEMQQPQEQSEPAEQLTPDEIKRFTVLGSGVIGLLTAHELADQGHAVTVISKEGQPTENTPSTSSIAVGQFLPWVPAEHAEKILSNMEGGLPDLVETGRAYYDRLAQNPHETGVMAVRNVELIGDDAWPEGLPEAMRVSERTLQEPVTLTGPHGERKNYNKEYTFETYSINTRKTIPWLAAEAAAKGIVFKKQHVTPEQLRELDGVVVNATGMGAQELTGATNIENFKGHTIVLRPGEGRQTPKEAVSVDDLVIVPREDGTVVAGALYREHPESVVPAADEAAELRRRLAELAEKTAPLVEGLEPELFTEGEVLLHSAGYRVEVTDGGIWLKADGEIENLLHAYGFGGIGWSAGPAFAKRIAAEAVEMHDKSKEQ